MNKVNSNFKFISFLVFGFAGLLLIAQSLAVNQGVSYDLGVDNSGTNTLVKADQDTVNGYIEFVDNSSPAVTIDSNHIVALADPLLNNINNWQGINQIQAAGQITSKPNLSLPVTYNGEPRVNLTNDPIGACQRVLALTIDKNDPDTASTGAKRAELRYKDVAPEGVNVWQAMRLQIADMNGAQDQQLIMQWPNTEAGGVGYGINPAFAFYLNGSKLSIVHRSNSNANPSNETNISKTSYVDNDFAFDTWTEFIINARINPTGNGFIKIWRDGVEIVNYQGPFGYIATTPENAKIGFYHYGTHTYNPFDFADSKTMYFDHMSFIRDINRQYNYQDVKAFMDNKSPCS